ncbi:hypothetical protein Dpoa569_0001333 [Dickeya poaceiphila]|uniref:Phage neck terminator protein gp12-like domain-containing protein n=2 Tax=Dickeya poaceiphila TaxID=568768 RepID=A0A5B8ILB6_9GAMM|nr:hypothetical protein Dpoa569_0001333 [Dickeya poaceiphila]
MTATISISEDDLTTALRGFLLSLVDVSDCVLGQENNVPMPEIGTDYIVMTPIDSVATSTNKWVHDGENGQKKTNRNSQWRCQIDFYGPNAQNNAVIISTMIRDEYAAGWFSSNGSALSPLYSNDPHQTTMINGEQQYEPRWTMDFIGQTNPVITTPQQYMTSANPNAVPVNVQFPPQG